MLEITHYLFHHSFCREWALKEWVGERSRSRSRSHLLKTLESERHTSLPLSGLCSLSSLVCCQRWIELQCGVWWLYPRAQDLEPPLSSDSGNHYLHGLGEATYTFPDSGPLGLNWEAFLLAGSNCCRLNGTMPVESSVNISYYHCQSLLELFGHVHVEVSSCQLTFSRVTVDQWLILKQAVYFQSFWNISGSWQRGG